MKNNLDIGIILDLDGGNIKDVWVVPLNRIIETIEFQSKLPQDEKSVKSGQLFYMDELHSLYKKKDTEHFRMTLINLVATLDDFKKIFKPLPKNNIGVIVVIDTKPVVKTIRVKECTYQTFFEAAFALGKR